MVLPRSSKFCQFCHTSWKICPEGTPGRYRLKWVPKNPLKWCQNEDKWGLILQNRGWGTTPGPPGEISNLLVEVNFVPVGWSEFCPWVSTVLVHESDDLYHPHLELRPNWAAKECGWLMTMVIYVSPLRIRLWDPFHSWSFDGLYLYMWVILTTYILWDEPPSRVPKRYHATSLLGTEMLLGKTIGRLFRRDFWRRRLCQERSLN